MKGAIQWRPFLQATINLTAPSDVRHPNHDGSASQIPTRFCQLRSGSAAGRTRRRCPSRVHLARSQQVRTSSSLAKTLPRVYGASQADLDVVAAFARSHGLTVVESSIARRTVNVSGSVAQMNKAFAVELGQYQSPTEQYRGREGHIHLPHNLAPLVEGVFGLDNRRMARPLLGRTQPGQAPRAPLAGVITPVTPPQVAKLYNFPASASAAGQTIGLLEFGGGYAIADIQNYFSGPLSPLGPGFVAPEVVPMFVDNAPNAPDDSAESAEVALDIEVAASVAQGAKIAVYFAPWWNRAGSMR